MPLNPADYMNLLRRLCGGIKAARPSYVGGLAAPLTPAGDAWHCLLDDFGRFGQACIENAG
ncbi:MAG: hypothetical protein H6645_05400 [Caldilineaceae bacterium]|nr:hypothetical protein [Caldilineaceae bacterium]